jgi:hypothetical protein
MEKSRNKMALSGENKYVKKGKIIKTVPSGRGADRKIGHYIEPPGLLLPGDLQITLWDKIYILGG